MAKQLKLRTFDFTKASLWCFLIFANRKRTPVNRKIETKSINEV